MIGVIGGFLKQVGVILLAFGGVGGYAVYQWWGVEMVQAAAVGCAVSSLNVLAGCGSAVWAFDKPQTVFLKAVLGGLTLRMMLIGATLFALLKFTDLSARGLTLSLFFFYLVYQILEVRFLVRHNAARHVSPEGV
ncbi:MAG: hypothetical protein VX910_09860 [Candidatus Latescibacterota bacterium]|nr:hypothetical protein [Candidatus Latescibacterota bacterium]